MPAIYTIVVLGIVVSLGLAGCDNSASSNSQPQATQSASTEADIPPRNQDMQQILRGGRIYQQNCATCHGKLAQGAENWRQRDEEGKFPPPPLDGSAHTWHHPTAQLIEVIKNGTLDRGGNMPAWKDQLSEQDIVDVLAWIKAQWPDEIYARWYRNDQRAKNR
ncbi:c-type cytochrome [Thiohalophilus thiocyanatoxydans]|nr:cytochrome c [Thiohalophilus thiocyanatoxydans]